MKSLNDFIKEPEKFEAHIKKDVNSQNISRELLEEHIDRTEKYFDILWKEKNIEKILRNFQKEIGIELSKEGYLFWIDTVKSIPFFHDLGKINPEFQHVLMKNEKINSKDRKLVRLIKSHHSILSAIFYLDYFLNEMEKYNLENEEEYLKVCILSQSYIISRHHSHLCSYKDYMENLLLKEGYQLLNLLNEKGIDSYIPTIELSIKEIKQLFREIKSYKKRIDSSKYTYLYFYTKLIYSLLVASDYYATSEFMNGVEIKDLGHLDDFGKWQTIFENTKLMKGIREYQKGQYPKSKDEIEKETNINVLRTEMLCDAEEVMKKDHESSLFYLEAPTGSGKSNTAIDLTFKLMEKNHSLKKVYYIYPFNTLVEQNINSLRKIFGDHEEIMDKIVVLNSLTPIKTNPDEKESGEYYQKALLNKQFLNYPFILSTHVTLFHTLFGYDKESVFGFHQLCNSVIVLDEIQSYKNSLWGEIIHFLKAAAHLLNIKIIIMSATLPNLDVLSEKMEPAVRLLPDSRKYFEHPCFKDRVKVSYEFLDQNDENIEEVLIFHMKKQVSNGKKVLVEFIKKKTAAAFFHKLKNDDEIADFVEYMSGDDSILERNRILKNISETSGPIILIATQVIEAGVDIDMDIGYKNISKLDSEEQFMGRINRSCLKKDSIVYFFKIDDSKSIYKEEVRVNPQFTLEEESIRENLLDKDFEKYYKKILAELQMNYKNTVSGLEEFLKEKVAKMDFPAVSEKMQLIPDNDWSMSVYLSRTLIFEDGSSLDGSEIWNEYKQLLTDNSLDYAEQKIKLSKVTSKMNYFIYQIKRNPDLIYEDCIGELFYIEDGEKYFENDKLNREKVQGEIGDFVDFI